MADYERTCDALVEAAIRQPFSGWDFSYLQGRMLEEQPTWDYPAHVRQRLSSTATLLDMGTGGGEMLASLAPLPVRTAATEAYAPNVPIARARLAPLGVEVVHVAGAPDNLDLTPKCESGVLPFPIASFSLVINRHESYVPREVLRVLGAGGRFVTQQVGGRHLETLADALGAPRHTTAWDCAFAVRQLEHAGFLVAEQREEYPETVFMDVGAVAYYLKAIPWAVPDYSLDTYRDRLILLHEQIVLHGGLHVRGHYFYIEAVKTAGRSAAC